MRNFSKVSPLLWRDAKFRSLRSPDAKLLYLYITTSEHQNSAGCYRLPSGYACADLGCDEASFLAAREALIAGGLIDYDDDTSEVYVLGWFASNPITNRKHYQGSLRMVVNIESERLLSLVEEELELSEREREEKATISASVTPLRRVAS